MLKLSHSDFEEKRKEKKGKELSRYGNMLSHILFYLFHDTTLCVLKPFYIIAFAYCCELLFYLLYKIQTVTCCIVLSPRHTLISIHSLTKYSVIFIYFCFHLARQRKKGMKKKLRPVLSLSISIREEYSKREEKKISRLMAMAIPYRYYHLQSKTKETEWVFFFCFLFFSLLRKGKSFFSSSNE